jgi:hypothetical protein
MYDDLKTWLADHFLADIFIEQSISRSTYGGMGWQVETILLNDLGAYRKQDV